MRRFKNLANPFGPQPGIDENARILNTEKAQQLMGAAVKPGPEGDVARATLTRLAKQFPGAFPQGFAQDIQDQSPEGQARINQMRLEAEGRRNNRKAGDKAKQEENDRIDMLNREGQEGAELAQRERDRNDAEDRRARNRAIMEGLQQGEQDVHNARRLRNILKPDEQQGQAGIMGVQEFANKIATGGVDKAQATREKQLETLEKIRDFLEDMDMQAKRNQAQVAIAAGD
jgi:hypothetical protein